MPHCVNKKNTFALRNHLNRNIMFQSEKVNNPPTTSKSEGRSGIFKFSWFRSLCCGLLLKSQRKCETKRKTPKYLLLTKPLLQ